MAKAHIAKCELISRFSNILCLLSIYCYLRTSHFFLNYRQVPLCLSNQIFLITTGKCQKAYLTVMCQKTTSENNITIQ